MLLKTSSIFLYTLPSKKIEIFFFYFDCSISVRDNVRFYQLSACFFNNLSIKYSFKSKVNISKTRVAEAIALPLL